MLLIKKFKLVFLGMNSQRDVYGTRLILRDFLMKQFSQKSLVNNKMIYFNDVCNP